MLTWGWKTGMLKRFWFRNTEKSGQLKEVDVDGRIMLKWVLNTRTWSLFFCLTMRLIGRLFGQNNKISDSME
jgi:hypothetical protein